MMMSRTNYRFVRRGQLRPALVWSRWTKRRPTAETPPEAGGGPGALLGTRGLPLGGGRGAVGNKGRGSHNKKEVTQYANKHVI